MLAPDHYYIEGIRNPGEGCICKRLDWLHGYNWKTSEYRKYIYYYKINDNPLDDIEIQSNDYGDIDEDEYNNIEIFKISRNEYHKKLNPIIGNCFCCNNIVYKSLQHNCCDCNVLLCTNCVACDKHDYIPFDSGFVCYLCRVQTGMKNIKNYQKN
jgi:hypothetical protein